MKVFRVVVEVPGNGTEILREELRYATETIERVWEAIEGIRQDEEKTILAIIEESPAITVLK